MGPREEGQLRSHKIYYSTGGNQLGPEGLLKVKRPPLKHELNGLIWEEIW